MAFGRPLRFLLLGSKEYPVGSGVHDDRLPSGGYETYTARLAAALTKRGHDVTLITRRFSGQKKREKTNGLQVVRVPWLPGFYLRTPTFAFFSGLKLFFLDFDVAVSSGIWLSLVTWISCGLRQKPWICRPGGIASSQPQYPGLVRTVLRHLERFVYGRAPVVVFLSPAEKESFQSKLGFLPKKFVIIPTGVDVPPLSRLKNKNRGKKTVLFVGRLLPVKGVSYLLDAMKNVNARLWIVGDGPDRNKLEMQAAKSNLDVEFFGFQNDVDSYYRRADVFVLPSLSEGLPLSLLEAYAAGLPCIVTDIGLPAENGKTALVVPSKNAPALNRALKEILSKPRFSARLGKNARHLAKTFSWDKTARGYEEVALKCVA